MKKGILSLFMTLGFLIACGRQTESRYSSSHYDYGGYTYENTSSSRSYDTSNPVWAMLSYLMEDFSSSPNYYRSYAGYNFEYHRSHKASTEEEKKRYGENAMTPEWTIISCPKISSRYGYDATFVFRMGESSGHKWGETTVGVDITLGKEILGKMEFANFLSKQGSVNSFEQKFTPKQIGGLYGSYELHGEHLKPYGVYQFCFDELFAEMDRINNVFVELIGCAVLDGNTIPDYNSGFFQGTRISAGQKWTNDYGYVYDADSYNREINTFESVVNNVPSTYQGYEIDSFYRYGVWRITLTGETLTSGSTVKRKYGMMELVFGSMESVSFGGGYQVLQSSRYSNSDLAHFSMMEVDASWNVVSTKDYSYNSYSADKATALQVASVALSLARSVLSSYGLQSYRGVYKTEDDSFSPAKTQLTKSQLEDYIKSNGVNQWGSYVINEMGWSEDGMDFFFDVNLLYNPSNDYFQIYASPNILYYGDYLLTAYLTFNLLNGFQCSFGGAITSSSSFAQTLFYVDNVVRKEYPSIDANSGSLGEIISDGIGLGSQINQYVAATVSVAFFMLRWVQTVLEPAFPNHCLW